MKPKPGTVAALVEQLLKLPQDLPVYCSDDQGNTDKIGHHVSVWKVESCNWMSGPILDEGAKEVVFVR